MACLGECKVQLYDVDVTKVEQTITAEPPQIGEMKWVCRKLSPEELEDYFHVRFTRIEGCADAKEDQCVCSPTGEEKWSDWSTITANGQIKEPSPFQGHEKVSCVYTLSGTYRLSSAVVTGVCQKYDQKYKMPRHRKHRPEKAKESGAGSETEKKH